MTNFVLLGRADDIPEAAARGFDPHDSGRDVLFVVRKHGQLHGWWDRCPHEGVTPLPYRRHRYLDKAGERIVCFAHGARFDIRTGQCLKGPCRGEFLAPVVLHLDAAGGVWADLAGALDPTPAPPALRGEGADKACA